MKAEGEEPEQDTSSSTSTMAMTLSPQVQTYVYMVVFFLAMIGHEVALEAASDSFSQLDALASAVTCFQMSFCVFLPLILSKGEDLEHFPKTKPEILPYVRLSLFVFGATGLSTQAVRYVTYPTKVVFKSAKLIPTMAVATVWQGHKYSKLEYLAAFLLCAGAAGYSYGSGNNHNDNDNDTAFSAGAAWGIALLISSIICDAVVPNYQKLILNQGVAATQLMINTNAVGTLAVLAYMLLTGQLFAIIATCNAHPKLILYLTGVGIGLSTAVWAYTKLIQATSSVVAVAVSTLRKVATIFLSYIIFPKPLLTIHIYAGCLVLLGMVLSSVAKERATAAKHPHGNIINAQHNDKPETTNGEKHEA
ncbi:Adenosine 3'-phospho 5'-phosphosulfate transporter 2 [Seminavis robusta]|uniref:Adenosine 3'-phospho 5'-phosphosulfate transporter 2 n=1 Tax=Seminavis robusta TaxID=568900 RepID=A0A9N8D9U2_9STRA|nr:Adenosine 3'-phospho 5'-phosphosulfate transporter 2 [Seminavis robusta]|eukprot:Sro10_g008090.1 Adenosine 3'-phospho 5'-phosphosulfate transporter 2 (363) ;mRNA; f:111293-112381